MKILVTGGLGAVGAPLTGLLRERGHEVWVLDRPHDQGVKGGYYFRCDVGEFRQLENVFDRVPFDFVFHTAAEFGRINGEDFYETMWRTNAVGTKNMIRLQEKRRFRMVVFSSSEIYGDWDALMLEETPDQNPIRQMNDYAISKWVNDLNHHRTSSYIDDTCRTLAAIADRFRAGAVYNIAGDTYHDIKTVSNMILKQCGKDDRLVEYVDKERHNTLDKKTSAERARKELGHQETVSLEEGIARTIAWQRKRYGVDR